MLKITTTEPTQHQCRHIFTDGRRCASPTLRSPLGHEPFCYYHHTTRGAASMTTNSGVAHSRGASSRVGGGRHSNFTLPLPEDRSSIQHSIGEVLRRIAANEIDSRRAGLLLYGLQIASLNLKKDSKNEIPDEQAIVTEITHDPDHGLLAPPAELHANQPIGSAQRLLMELGDLDFPANDETDDERVGLLSSELPQPELSKPELPLSEPPQPEPQTAASRHLTIDLQACAAVADLALPHRCQSNPTPLETLRPITHRLINHTRSKKQKSPPQGWAFHE